MNEKDQTYLTALSILLGVSVLKLTEIFKLGDELKELIESLQHGLSLTVVAVFVFVAGYVLFFALVGVTSISIVRQISLSPDEADKRVDNGPLVAMCLGTLAVSYLTVFGIVIYISMP